MGKGKGILESQIHMGWNAHLIVLTAWVRTTQG